MTTNILDLIRNFYVTYDNFTYPNTIVLNKDSLNQLEPKLSKLDVEDSMHDKLFNYYGLRVIYTEHPIEPRLLRL